MNRPTRGRPSQNQATRVRPVLRVLFDNLTCFQDSQDLVLGDVASLATLRQVFPAPFPVRFPGPFR